MPAKTKTPQPETSDNIQGRDCFQTPKYATKLLLPFIPKAVNHIWECASGEGRIAEVLMDAGYSVTQTDLAHEGLTKVNFLHDSALDWGTNGYTAIITNPPFSLKQKFYKRCREFRMPFALLIPADYCGWTIRATEEGCEKIIPERRIDYITPLSLERINKKYLLNYKYIKDIPLQYLIDDLSTHKSDFHSLWLTWGFGLGKSEVFVPLENETKKDI